MNRRDFLKAQAMTAATLAAARLANAAAPARADAVVPRVVDGVRWDKAPCRFCGTGCHVQVGVKDQKVVAIAGDSQAEVNRGMLCVKGYHVGLALYGKDRLTTPLLRRNGKLEPVSWEVAIDKVVERILLDPAGFAIYGSGQWTIPEGYLANKLIKAALASNQIDPNARLCMASAVTGFLATYGVDEPAGCYEDLDAADVVILWGNNPAEMHPVLFSRLMDRRSRGEKFTLIDLQTRRTRTSAFADKFLLFKPHGDLAVANGIAHQLLENGTWSKAFVEKHCAFRIDGAAEAGKPNELNGVATTFETYREKMAFYTPAKVEELSGVPAKEIVALGALFGDPKLRITSLWCMGMNQHTRGTAINTLVHGIHLLSGHFGRPGDAPTSLTGQPSACGTVREVGTLAHALPGGFVVGNEEHRKKAEALWNLPEGRINKKPGLHTVDLWKSFSTPKDKGGAIHTIWNMVTNPAQSLPNRNALVDPSRSLPDKFLIVSDVYPTETVRMADLVLPSALWVEKNGMFGNSERRTQQWFKMVPPPGQARDDAWQLIAVARKLFEKGFPGARDKDGQSLFAVKKDGQEVPVWDWARYYDVNVDAHFFEEYRGFSRAKHKNLAPYAEYVKSRGLRWPVVQQPDGSWRETRFRFAAFDDPFVKPGQDFDFYHSTTKDGRAQIWFRPWESPPEVPDAEYPFWLCTGRVLEHWHTGSMTRRIPQLHRAVPNSYVELHPADARRLGLRNGERCVIESRRGKVEVPVWIDGRGAPPEGSLFVPFFDESMLINRVTLEDYDPFSKQPDYKKCAVRIYAADRAPAGKGGEPAKPAAGGAP